MVDLRTPMGPRPLPRQRDARSRRSVATLHRLGAGPALSLQARDTGLPPLAPAATDPSAPLSGRRFLIVTAPFGPFSRTLADVLTSQGAQVSRMLFNIGDEMYWRRAGGIRFKQAVRRWPDRVAELAPYFTDILLFGEGGAYNQAVLTQAEQIQPRVWVLENGYFRPDWITVERDGVNASSRLPRSPEAYAAKPPELPTVRPAGKVLPHHVVNISLYHLALLPGRLLYPKYVAPYTQPPWLQCFGHIRRYFSLAFRRKTDSDAAAIAARGPFYIACLQREGDAQLLRYSHFADNTAFLAEVMTSFARHAPPEARLVVKNHPLDPGLVDLAKMTRVLAIERGLAERVDFIDGGNLAQLCRASRGMVVNNSSAALSALGFQTPVKVLGEAFFDMKGLTHQAPLDSFWTRPERPDAALFTRFRAHVIAMSQVNGNYHEPAALRPTAEGLAQVFRARSD